MRGRRARISYAAAKLASLEFWEGSESETVQRRRMVSDEGLENGKGFGMILVVSAVGLPTIL